MFIAVLRNIFLFCTEFYTLSTFSGGKVNGNTMCCVINMEFTFLLEKQKLQEVLLRKLKICIYRFNYFLLTSINNRNRLFRMWKLFICLSVILTISLITDTHDTLLKCKQPVRRFHASKIKPGKAKMNYYNNSVIW